MSAVRLSEVRSGWGALRFGGQGRPLRFLMIVVGGWTGARVALLWPEAQVERLAAVTRAARAPTPHFALGTRAPTPLVAAGSLAAAEVMLRRSLVAPAVPAVSRVAPPVAPVSIAAVEPVEAPSITAPVPVNAGTARYDAAQPVATALPTRPRWSGSAWAFVRGAGDAGGVATPQLGGSQIGARIAYRLDARGRVAAVARVAAATGVRQQEAAVGVEWQPTRLPIRLVAEQRIGIANIRGGPAIGLVGGVSALPLGAGLHVDGYAQGGVIARDRADGYIDGAVSVGRTIASRGRARLELGLGAWGAAQRGAARLDLGPSLVAVLPVEARAIRVGVQWRERVAGNARPGSGAVLSIGADF
ncbi:hypothetical protein HRV97_12260 [Sphingomonas sp. HHU CXW]|uniref:Haemolysin activator HlyB C-terminal domain-containing protein n=1 Tax=Sphingomonas hominis TaxID=2741495 RepID=A0ABX2JHS4_9SPHN|nr:hypothetical protein [Sphingomonas hominis]NTS65933.1 hypothetical protein [Sphingomonas hominis]